MLTFIVNGLGIGGVFALSGVGVLVLYRTTGVLNLAHGAVGALGAMLTWQFISGGQTGAYASLANSGMPSYIAIALAVLIGAAISFVFGLLAGPFLARLDQLKAATTTLGLALAILGLINIFWPGFTNKGATLNLQISKTGFRIFGARVTETIVICILLALVITVVTMLTLRYSSIGAAMRALASDRDLAAVLGTRVRLVELLAWSASGAIAAISGVLGASLSRLDPTFLTFFIIPILSAVVIGRFVSLPVTFLAGFVVAVAQNIVASYSSLSPYASATPFLIALIAMIAMSWKRQPIQILVVRQ